MIAIAVIRKIPPKTGSVMSFGNSVIFKDPEAGNLGKTIVKRMKRIAEITAIHKKVVLQPTYKPTIRPNGKPTTIATEVAATIILKPNDFLPSGAIFTAKGEAIDQKIACAQATPILEVIKVAKFVDTVDKTWLKTKRPTTVNNNFFKANFDAIIIKGSDAIITTQAYTVISMPA